MVSLIFLVDIPLISASPSDEIESGSSSVLTFLNVTMYYPNLIWHLMQLPPIDEENVIEVFTRDSNRVTKPLFPTPYIKRKPLDGRYHGYTIPDGYKVIKEIDSLSGDVRVGEYYDDVEINGTYNLSLDEYLRYRKKELQQQAWDSITRGYSLDKALSKGDLAKLIAKASGMKIPLPPNPVLGLFGKPEISINVNGEANVTIGWRWDSQNLGTVSQFGQTQSSPVFDQDIRVNVSASIGDKLKLSTDWNTRRQFDQDNTFKIGYEGYDDDIVRLVEVGNVTLPTQSTLIGGGEALFGVRADFQFGPLYLKSIFSQRRGQRRFVDVTGGMSRQQFSLRAYDYAQNHFFLDTAYIRFYDQFFENGQGVIPRDALPYSIKEIEVWESANQVQDFTQGGNVIAIADLEAIPWDQQYDEALKNAPPQAGKIEQGTFMRLDSTKFTIDRNLGTLAIRNLRTDRYYAVAYRIEWNNPTSEEDDLKFGTLSTETGEREKRVLKLIYRPSMQPGFETLWKRQMRNVYQINASNVNLDQTEINIWYILQSNDSSDVIEGVPDKIVTILGVDQQNNATGSPEPDGLFDKMGAFFNPRTGEITFPTVEPFGDGLRDYFNSPEIGNPELAELYTFDEVYDTTYDIARLNTARDRFIISGYVSGSQSNRISLGAFNLQPGSVKVTLDGVPLVEYQDYVIDYFSGTLTIRNQRAMLPNANLRVQYEQRDIFNIATRTLAGLRGDYILHRDRRMDAVVGFTFMHYDQAAIIDRVRLGEEPVANTMLGFDATFQWDTPWITKLLDALPFFDTRAKSSITAKGEWAIMLPNPNKRKSTVRSDNFEPVVYIDDFDGAQRYIPLGLNALQWQHSSQPLDSTIWQDAVEASQFRGNLFWWQYFIPRIPIREVYPRNESFLQGRNNISPLFLKFDADTRGIYNTNADFLDETNEGFFDPTDRFSDVPENREKIWGGMQKLLSTFSTNFDAENIEFIEIMMNVQNYEQGNTKLYVDLGIISEDIIPNNALDTEDGNTEENGFPNGIIDAGEDTGIDGINDEEERSGDIYGPPLDLEDDPARDNYFFDFAKQDQDRVAEDFRFYNNFEGNSTQSELGQFPDREVLNPNNGETIITDNSYFSYEVNLSPDETQNSQIVGKNGAWILRRIPIRSPDERVGNPLFSNIQYARLRVEGGDFEAMIADWRLLGSQWQRNNNFQSGVEPDDSVMSLQFVNLWENSGAPDFYTMPPGVSAPRQLNNPDPTQDIRMNEQSISLTVNNLRYGAERMAVRIFQPLDIFYYKRLKFFVHGDGTMPTNIVEGQVPDAYMFLRFGIDSLNYYEYKIPIVRGWQDININLAELTAIKQIRDRNREYERQEFPVANDPFATFAIRGNPILTRVQFFGLGIANPSERFPNDLTTTMWVNELRLVSPEDAADWAAIGSVSMKLADLGTINANIETSQPNFHRLEERFGPRISATNWTVSMQGNLEKFAPKSFKQMQIPISYTHSEFTEVPEFVANNDINLEQAAEASRRIAFNEAIEQGLSEEEADALGQQAADETLRRSQTLRVVDSWSLTGVKLGIPISHWLIRDTFNKLVMGYSYSQEYERNPIYEQRFNWIWRLSLGYNITISDIATVKPFSWAEEVPVLKFFKDTQYNFLPNDFNASLDMQRRRQTEQSRFLDFPSPVVRDFSAVRAAGFNWRISEKGMLSPEISYNFSTNSTLSPLELDDDGRQKTGSEIANEILFNDGIVNFGKDTRHSQTVELRLRPNLIFPVLNQFIDLTASFSTTYNWTDPLQQNPEVRDQVKNASFNNDITVRMPIRLQAMGNKLFGAKANKGGKALSPSEAAREAEKGDGGFIGATVKVLRTIFFDWETVNISFQQGNSAINPGVFGGSGFTNFWQRGVTFRESRNIYGPSMAYQLGLIEHPHGGFDIESSARFPFFKFRTYDGTRPPNAILQDNFRQQTTFKIDTERPLWEGASLQLNWQSELGYNRNWTVITDEFGNPTFTNVLATESISRSFLTFPTVFGLTPFGTNIENVVNIYEEKKFEILSNPEIDSVQRNRELKIALSESFYEGLRALNFIGGAAGKFLPSMNWAINWEGLEKYKIWGGILQQMRMEHAYTSSYQENVQITDLGRDVQTQTVEMRFEPVVKFTSTFDEELFDGDLNASLSWTHSKSYQLTTAAQSRINAQTTNDITAEAGYRLNGFELPLFGFVLENDLEYRFQMTYKRNLRTSFDVLNEETYTGENEGGQTVDGNTQIIIEPSARYSVSERLIASFFVRYEGTFTEGAAQPGFHTTQVGFNLRLSLSGGR